MGRVAVPLESLSRLLPGRVLVDPALRDRLGRDASYLSGGAAAVVRPRTVPDLVRLILWARREKIGLVARGGGTSLNGESSGSPSTVSVDFGGWDRIRAVDPSARRARLEPGVVNADLDRALAHLGLFFPPNPGSWQQSTVGGNAATNASGPRSFRYGPTRRWIVGARAVLGTGELLRLGTDALKRSAGPDLLGAFVGSEGTLGWFTELTVALAPRPASRRGLVVPLPARVRLGRLAVRLAGANVPGLSAVEFADRPSARLLGSALGTDPGPGGLLMAELEASRRSSHAEGARRLLRALRAEGVDRRPTWVAEADELWTLRGRAGTQLDAEMGRRIREDVAVPLARLDELVDTLRRIARRSGVPFAVYGHLGEGNVHPNFGIDPASAGGRRLRRAVLLAAHRLGGTVSGEHGIGLVKSSWLNRELGTVAVDLLRSFKRRCDPDGILNPGKLLPTG
ncbi:MAG: FAD-binding oxidoreductase [Thermoplasmata archaeon]|nr:FAD-binding oxidoreductase [Thermoplasmata archaeon]